MVHEGESRGKDYILVACNKQLLLRPIIHFRAIHFTSHDR